MLNSNNINTSLTSQNQENLSIQGEHINTNGLALAQESSLVGTGTKRISNYESEKNLRESKKSHQNSKLDLIKFCEDVINCLSSEQIYDRFPHDFQGDGTGKLRGKPPFRESKSGTSFTVFSNKGFFDAGGNFSGSPIDYIHSLKIGYYERAKGKDWVEALKELAQVANLEFPNNFNNSDNAQKWLNRQNILTHAYKYLHNALLSETCWKAKKARDYLHSRGINDETIKILKIGFYDSWVNINNYLVDKGFTPEEIQAVGLQRGKFITENGIVNSKHSCSWTNFITFPWYDAYGNPLSLYGRYFQTKPDEPKTPKTLALHGSGTKKHPFLFNLCKENNHTEVIFVEGLFDAIALYQAGITNVCSGVGASFSNQQIACLANNRVKKVWHLGDPDGGGENGTKSNLKRLLSKGIDVFVPEKLPDGLDPDEFLLEHGVDTLRDLIKKAEHGLSWLAKLTASGFNDTEIDYISDVLAVSAKLEREYVKAGVNPLLFAGYYSKTLKSIMNIDSSEFNFHFDLEREKVAEQIKETLDAVTQWDQYEIAINLAEKYRDRLAYDGEIQQWRRYGAEYDGVWSLEADFSVIDVISSEIYTLSFKFAHPQTGVRPSVSNSFVNGVLALLKSKLGMKKWHKPKPHLLPLLNGVLDLKTKQLLPHSQSHNLTWCLPYEFCPIATCNPIQQWLKEMAKDDGVVELIRAYLRAIVTGRSDLHKFTEFTGPGGSGKSTVMRLATALIGRVNTHTTTLEAIEKNQFECASLADKRLLLITDSERYGGGVATLKALTGGDSIRYEQKYKQSKGGFNPKILVMMASNEQIQSSDYTSGLSRRRITIPFTNKIKDSQHRNLIEVNDDKLEGEFAPFIAGLLNWVLAMSDEDMVSYLKNTSESVPYLNEQKLESLLDSNPLADWVNRFIILRPENKAYIGIKTGNHDTQLYASYCTYMEDSGSKPVALRRFSSLLKDLFNFQLNIPLTKYRDRWGTYFMDIAVRHTSDDDPLLITGNYTHLDECNINDNHSPPHASTHNNGNCQSFATDPPCVGKNEGIVTDETLTSAESDGCVSKNQKSLDLKEDSLSYSQDSENNKNPEIYLHNQHGQSEQGIEPDDLPTQPDDFTVTASGDCNTNLAENYDCVGTDNEVDDKQVQKWVLQIISDNQIDFDKYWEIAENLPQSSKDSLDAVLEQYLTEDQKDDKTGNHLDENNNCDFDFDWWKAQINRRMRLKGASERFEGVLKKVQANGTICLDIDICTDTRDRGMCSFHYESFEFVT